MIWLLPIFVVGALIVVGALHCAKSQKDVTSYETMVGLHAVRRRLDLAQFKYELRRNAADARRELRAELDGLEKRRRR